MTWNSPDQHDIINKLENLQRKNVSTQFTSTVTCLTTFPCLNGCCTILDFLNLNERLMKIISLNYMQFSGIEVFHS